MGGELGRLCIYGGFTKDHQPNNVVYTFDILSQTWLTVAYLDPNNKAEVLSIAQTNSPSIFILESENDKWRSVEAKMGFSYIADIPHEYVFEFEIEEVELYGEYQAVFSTVYEADYFGKRVVVKTFKAGGDDQNAKWSEFLDDFHRELSGPLLRERVTGISVAIGVCRKPLMLMFEYKQPLIQYAANHPLTIPDVITHALQLAFFAEEFACQKLVHGDLKMQNCLIDNDKNLWLCDLGLVQNCFEKKERFYSFHAAPELWTEEKRGDDLRREGIHKNEAGEV